MVYKNGSVFIGEFKKGKACGPAYFFGLMVLIIVVLWTIIKPMIKKVFINAKVSHIKEILKIMKWQEKENKLEINIALLVYFKMDKEKMEN